MFSPDPALINDHPHLQAELRQAQEEAGALRAGNEDVASLQEQLAAAHEEASGLRNSNEDVDYLQAQLRRTLRDNVELRHQVRQHCAALLPMMG